MKTLDNKRIAGSGTIKPWVEKDDLYSNHSVMCRFPSDTLKKDNLSGPCKITLFRRKPNMEFRNTELLKGTNWVPIDFESLCVGDIMRFADKPDRMFKVTKGPVVCAPDGNYKLEADEYHDSTRSNMS
jgi:hypothetical protein